VTDIELAPLPVRVVTEDTTNDWFTDATPIVLVVSSHDRNKILAATYPSYGAFWEATIALIVAAALGFVGEAVGIAMNCKVGVPEITKVTMKYEPSRNTLGLIPELGSNTWETIF
jgi:hypothetical protein